MFSHYYAGRTSSTDYVQRYQESPHKPRIDHVAKALVARHYGEAVIAQHLREWLRLAISFDRRGLPLPSSARAVEVQEYVAQRLPRGSASRRRFLRASARIFLETDARGQVRLRVGSPPGRPPGPGFAPAIGAYGRFVRQHRGLADRTVRKRTWQLTRFAEFVEQAGVTTISGIHATQIQRFFTGLEGQTPATRLTYGVTLRSFLRWACLEGLLPADLNAATITARHHRHTGIRDVLTDEEVHRLLSAVDPSSAIGRRDYAVLLLAARYGLRPSDIRQLRLDDVHWRQGVLTIQQAKTGRPLSLPLLPEVTTGLVAYLRDGRPVTDARHLFIRHRAPFEPFVAANNLNTIMRTALRQAGLAERPGRRGLYLFRHTLATRLLAAECPIKTIGDVLGHASTDSTMEYANVDLAALRRVALSEAEIRA
jgi:integrase